MTNAPLPDDIPATLCTEHTQELRIATAMTGGVSLAIWMGGVARELNLLEQASRIRESLGAADSLPEVTDLPAAGADSDAAAATAARTLYLRLLDLLDVTVDVDMLSGTSAGGINAALLGFTRSRRIDLGILRDVWLRTGSFDLLLRDPSEKSPPSLLRGDGVLLDGLSAGIAELASAPPTSVAAGTGTPDPPPTTVFITTTLLSGETSRFSDAFGTLVQDVEHRGLFRFDEWQLQDDGHQNALALAARCSASFPGAFEPAYVPVGSELAAHPDMAEFANTTRSHYVADGGLIMNRPIKPLIEAVFDREADRQVRRVLLYVVPSPGSAPDPTATPAAESFAQPYTFGAALLKDLGAALNQSISAELRAIRDHNDSVDGIADTRLRVAELGSRPHRGHLQLLRADALADFRRRQSRESVQPVVTAFMRGVTTMPQSHMPKSWKNALGPGSLAEADCRGAAADAVADQWFDDVPAPGDIEPIVSFGRAPFDGAKATVIAMLRDAWRLAVDDETRARLSTATKSVHDSLAAPEPLNLARLVADRLAEIGPTSTDTLRDVASELAMDVVTLRDGSPADLAAGWRHLADALLRIAPVLGALAASPPGPATSSENERARARAALTTYLRYFGNPDVEATNESDAAQISVDMTVSSLFQLHVVVRSMLPTKAAVEQHLDIIQVSADTRSALTPKYQFATDKLTGMQFHHFGAFYKSSWRANDWMWGRLDGAGWLVHLLLDPHRIQVLAEAHCPAPGKREWFLGRVRDRIPGLGTPDQHVLDELAYLEDPSIAVPPSLPNLSMWMATPFQERVAVAELPVVAREILVNPTTRDSKWAVDVLKITSTPEALVETIRATTRAVTSGDWDEAQRSLREWLATAPQPSLTGPDRSELLAKLQTCPVPKERLGDEVGEPLFTRTVSKAVAVATAATAEAQEMPTVVKPALGTVRTMTLLAYRLAAVTRGRFRAVVLAGAALTILGIVLLATAHVFLGFTGVVVMGAGIYLLLLASWKSLRSAGDIIAFIVTGAVLIVAGVLLFDRPRGWLFDTPESKHGIVTQDVLPWLRDPAWHAPVVFLALAALIAGVTLLVVKAVKK